MNVGGISPSEEKRVNEEENAEQRKIYCRLSITGLAKISREVFILYF